MNFQAPGADFQKYLPKSRAGTSSGASGERPGRPKTAPGGAKSAPRRPQDGPKSRQERPKSRPEAVSERPWWPPGPHLPPKRPPKTSRDAFWPPRGSILGPPGLHFLSPQRLLRSLPGSKRKRKGKRRRKRKAYISAWPTCSFWLASSCSFCVLGRLRSINSESWKPSIPEALGGRRGSRSD